MRGLSIWFRDIVSGRAGGVRGGLARCLLAALEIPYTLAVRRRNGGFDAGRRPVQGAGVPVVSVGNITLGGTGKTPFVEFLAKWFQRRGWQVAIVSRGYRSRHGLNDEARELAVRLPQIPHVQGRDRVAAAIAAEKLGVDVILLDDGFQHRRLFRDLDIVLIDSLVPDGYGRVFPRGMLREPWEGLERADVVVLTRANLLDVSGRERVRRLVELSAPHAAWAEAGFRPSLLLNSLSECRPLRELCGARAAVFCGVGNPLGFRHTVEAAGLQVMGFREFPDHYDYTMVDWENLEHWAKEVSAEVLLCTHKDLVKFPRDGSLRMPLWALIGEVEFLAGWEKLETRLNALVERRSKRSA